MAVQRDLISLTLAAVAVVVVAAVGLPSQGCPSPDGGGLQYTVGDSDWTLPPTADYYTNWSSSHFFKIGDSLVFKFEKWRYNVVQVTKQDYESCTAYKPLKVFNSGPVNISLPEKGVFYFICYISNYCSLGMKISITVHDCPSCIEPPSSPSPSPSPSPPPPASPALVPPPSSPPSRSAQPPSQGNPGGPAFQPPVQVTSPAPSPVNSSPEAPSNSGALVHKGMLGVGSYELFFGLFLVVVVFG